MNDTEKALLGAIEMLHKIANGEIFFALEYQNRLNHYKEILLTAQPELKNDPYFNQFFN